MTLATNTQLILTVYHCMTNISIMLHNNKIKAINQHVIYH